MQTNKVHFMLSKKKKKKKKKKSLLSVVSPSFENGRVVVSRKCAWNLKYYCPALTEVSQRVTLLAKVIIQGNMTEYYPARDMLSTNDISNIAYEY